MRVIDAPHINATLTFDTLIPALRHAFESEFGMPQRSLFHLPNGTDQADSFALLPAWNDAVIGVKAFTHFPNNAAFGHDILASKVLLFSRDTGAPLAVVDGTELTLWRTAATSALAADYLARAHCRSLLLFGTGRLAPFMARAHAAVRPSIEVIYVAGRSEDKTAKTVADIKAHLPHCDVISIENPAQIVPEVDLISCATGSPTPLFSYADIRAGVHIDLVGNHHRDRRECDSATVATAQVFVDSRLNVLNEAGELLIPLQEGEITEAHVLGELADLCRGKIEGRTEHNDITLFKSVGSALSDLAAAHLVYQASTA
ncbi:ornithine cyclodeaminase family protein [Neptunomonas marina]|uniref:Ornithine cyclodeaminase family protein n=1 Tax=Neptunomonas marina TaxID=1815562 RepID=A0A437QAZ6_9GAMM|nr:ornithine cyclodeaminase family protein [Neptunomonas marina]RVU31645.1 ornithine cyclodeaminase family protein [Neptunomonas marina]